MHTEAVTVAGWIEFSAGPCERQPVLRSFSEGEALAEEEGRESKLVR